MMRKRSARIVPGAKPRPSVGVETWPTLGEGETSRRASEGNAVGSCEGELAGAPHDEQNRARSGTSAAQLGHRIIVADCIPGQVAPLSLADHPSAIHSGLGIRIQVSRPNTLEARIVMTGTDVEKSSDVGHVMTLT